VSDKEDCRFGLRHGNLGHRSVHICVDMQRLFAEDTPWHTPWMSRVLPNVERLAAAHNEGLIFTRFIPPERAEDSPGLWRRYYEKWRSMTLEHLDPSLITLMPSLCAFVPPGVVVDKTVYSPWVDTELEERLQARQCDTMVVSGGETDVCVLATILGAIDRGYRVIVVRDAVCSSRDATHDASLSLYQDRFSEQIEVATTAEVLSHWP
jgi:nicotinamidase-related amidase